MEIPKTLSVVERQILVNQFLILSKLEGNSGSHYEMNADILTRGYTKEYGSVFSVDEEELPIENLRGDK